MLDSWSNFWGSAQYLSHWLALDRIISMGTNEGDLVFDPFGGSGTTYAVAQMLKRKWIGTELGDCDIIKNRLLHAEKDIEQLLKII